MSKRIAMRIVILLATLAAASAAAVAQTQQNQSQPVQKESIWQKLKNAAKQTGQNTVQQGTNTVQQGTQQAQQGVQQGVQGVQQGVQQQMQQLPGSAGQPANAGLSGSGVSSCGASCFDAGPFQANVSQMTMSQQGPWHIIRMNIQFHNSTNQPLTIAYREGSMVMVDNNGNTYQAAGGSPGELQGMGIDRGNVTDSQFVLGPGQTGNALFSVARARGNDSPIGTGFTYNFTIDELQAQNGALAIPVRQYNLNFPSLAPGSSNATTFAPGGPTNRFVGGGGNTAIGGAIPGPSQAVAGATNSQAGTATNQRKVAAGVPAQQQRMVNGRSAPTSTRPASAAVNNAAIRSTTATTAKPSPTVKPIPATKQEVPGYGGQPGKDHDK